MGSCLSSQPDPAGGAAPAWPQRWRKRSRGVQDGAADGGAVYSGGGGGKKLPCGGAGGDMTEEELARVAGRISANGANAAACLHTQQGRKGTNQDAMVVWEWRSVHERFLVAKEPPFSSCRTVSVDLDFKCCLVQGEKATYVTECLIRNEWDFGFKWCFYRCSSLS